MLYHDELKIKMHEFVKLVYCYASKFPKEETYGSASQLRRAALSVILNYTEGYARRRGDECKVYKNFLDISYGSLKEAKYLIYFGFDLGYICEDDYKNGISAADKVGKMLWGAMERKKE